MTSIHDKIVLIDCQTTGMHPKNGAIVQLGWCLYDSRSTEPPVIHKRILQLPNNAALPAKICKLLKMDITDLDNALSPEMALSELNTVIQSLGRHAYIIIHYAQFELSFLKSYFSAYLENSIFDYTTICTQKLGKRIFPNLPSYNLKALAGYFKLPKQPNNEVISHIEATLAIWLMIKNELLKNNISRFSELLPWMQDKHNFPKQTSYSYNIDSLERLKLPSEPGIYRMLSSDGRILYIGKATSLKDRVNSYFRGFKNRDKRKLEMLAQVWSIKTEICDTVLEAELLESDEIKRWNPPYNVVLKGESRDLIFYNNEFSTYSPIKTDAFRKGFFRPFNAIESLIDMHRCLLLNDIFELWGDTYTDEVFQQAWKCFCNRNAISLEAIYNAKPRQLLSIGCYLLRSFESQYGKYHFEKWWTAYKKNHPEVLDETIENLAEKIKRMFIRAADTKRKSRQLTVLLQSTIRIEATKKYLNIYNCKSDALPCRVDYKNKSMDISLYDKLSILLSAKKNKLISTHDSW